MKIKTIVITGCNRGLGLELAISFLKNNYKVIGLNRNESPITHKFYKELKYEANYTDLELSDLIKDIKVIDVLILNAGEYYEKMIKDLSTNKIKDLFVSNSLGPYSLLVSLTEKLELSRGKIISIGSKAEFFSMKDSEFYSITKLTFKEMLKAYSKILQSKGISLTHFSFPRISDNSNFSVDRFIKIINEEILRKTRIVSFIDIDNY